MLTQIIFLVVGFVTLGSALMVVTTRNLMHAALWLVSTLFGVAVLFALLNAGFPGGGAGGGVYRRNRHPVHLCRDADPQGDARPGSAVEQELVVGRLAGGVDLRRVVSSCFRVGAASRDRGSSPVRV